MPVFFQLIWKKIFFFTFNGKVLSETQLEPTALAVCAHSCFEKEYGSVYQPFTIRGHLTETLTPMAKCSMNI